MLRKLQGLAWGVFANVAGRFTKQRLIFKLGQAVFPSAEPSYRIDVFVHAHQLSADLVTAVTFGKASELRHLRERFSQNAKLYVLHTQGGQLGSFMWVKAGRDVKIWMIPLQADDRVVYAAYTPKDMRGKRLWAHLIRHAVDTDSVTGGQWYSDCHIYNKPSRRALERNGFDVIARKPVPL